MAQTARELRNKLLGLIREMGSAPEKYAARPGRDFVRHRLLGFENVMWLLLAMGSESIGKGLMEHFKFQEDAPSAAAFVQQRKKLLPKAMEDLFHRFTCRLRLEKRYYGYRLLAVDGTSLKSSAYPQDPLSYLPGTDRQHGWNKHHINALFDLENGIYTDIIVQKEREKNEAKALCGMAERSPIEGPVLVLADRNYGALNSLAHLENRRWKYVIRWKERGSVFGIRLPDSPVFDMPVCLTLGRLTAGQLRKENVPVPENYYHLTSQRVFDFLPVGCPEFYPLSFRIVRIKTAVGTETFLTNLSPDAFPSLELGVLYSKRWGIETSFRSLKYAVGLIHLHSKIPELVLQEIFAAFTIFNFVQAVSGAVEPPKSDSQTPKRLNFSDAVFACCHFLRGSAKSVEQILRRKSSAVVAGRHFYRPASGGNHISWFYFSSR